MSGRPNPGRSSKLGDGSTRSTTLESGWNFVMRRTIGHEHQRDNHRRIGRDRKKRGPGSGYPSQGQTLERYSTNQLDAYNYWAAGGRATGGREPIAPPEPVVLGALYGSKFAACLS